MSLKTILIKDVCSSIEILLKIDVTEKVDVKRFIENNVQESLNNIHISFEDALQDLFELSFEFSSTDEMVWKVVCTGSYLITKISECLNNNPDALLSITQSQLIKDLLQFIVSNGVHPSLLPGVGIFTKNREPTCVLNDLQKYKRLKAVCKFLNKIYCNPDLRTILLVNHFNDYLASLYQLSFAPIVKPNTKIHINDETIEITQQFWEALNKDQMDFRTELTELIANTNKQIIIKELIVLQGAKYHPLPNFMKRALSKQLSECLIGPGGVQALIQCLIDTTHLDIGDQWKHIDIILRLVSVKHGSISNDQYLNIVSQQLSKLFQSQSNECYIVVVGACIAALYENYSTNKYIQELIEIILHPFLNSTDKSKETTILNYVDIYNAVHKIDMCFSHPKLSIPIILLTPILHSLFMLRECAGKTNASLSFKLDNLLSKYFSSSCCNNERFFNAMIFEIQSENFPINRTIVYEIRNSEVIGIFSSLHKNDIEQNLTTLIEIAECAKVDKMIYRLFCFLLNIFCKSNYSLGGNFENKEHDLLCVTKFLMNLASNELVLQNLKSDPSEIVVFIKKYLYQYSTNIKKYENSQLNNDGCVTMALILLSILLKDEICDTKNLLSIKASLKNIIEHSRDEGVKYLSKEVLHLMSSKSDNHQNGESRFENAITHVCDSLLPVRAHGILELTKLLQEEDVETITKKEFVLCVFQENLKNSDSYIYLAAIKGLSALCMICTEDVLEILSKEYLNDSNKLSLTKDMEDENLKLRMKVGEILLQVTKTLGDKAMKHKVILLNSFLTGCHDTDNFLRASSLSNLAELCRVLSYKLGDIIFDILKSVEDIILYDKSIECRRAAVLVISSLIKGLGKESLFILRDALLPMYRSLKRLYNNEKEDAAVKLHAQIALEELNDIMMEIMAPILKNVE